MMYAVPHHRISLASSHRGSNSETMSSFESFYKQSEHLSAFFIIWQKGMTTSTRISDSVALNTMRELISDFPSSLFLKTSTRHMARVIVMPVHCSWWHASGQNTVYLGTDSASKIVIFTHLLK
jgi:hypothetical protein